MSLNLQKAEYQGFPMRHITFLQHNYFRKYLAKTVELLFTGRILYCGSVSHILVLQALFCFQKCILKTHDGIEKITPGKICPKFAQHLNFWEVLTDPINRPYLQWEQRHCQILDVSVCKAMTNHGLSKNKVIYI